MISGLKVHIRAQELREHLQARAEYHSGRIANYERAIEELRGEDADPTQGGSNVSRRVSLESGRDDHRRKAATLTYIATHLADDEYELSSHELREIEAVE